MQPMSSELVPSTGTSVQKEFNWDETFAETKALIEEDAKLTATIEEAQIRRFEVRVHIGFNLMALQESHSKNRYGDFTTVELPRLGITDRTFAHQCIRVAKLYQDSIVDRDQRLNIPALKWGTWRLLSSPSTHSVVVEQVLSGDIEATPEAIKEANEKLKLAEQSHKNLQSEFDIFKQQVKRELSLKNQELDLLKRDRQMREDEYAKLEAEKEQVAQSKVQVLKEDTPETKSKLAKIEQEIKNLEAQQKKLKEERDEKDKQLQFTNKYVDDLTKQIQGYNRDNQLIAHNKEIRFKWQQACDAFHLGIKQGMARMVTQHDAQQAFEGDDWARLADLEAALQRTLESLSALRKHTTIDASMDYVEAQ
jgi:DNA repair exonuclease SbcCD ATPase subunit